MNEALKDFYNKEAAHAERWRRRRWYYHKQIEDLCKFLIPHDASLAEVGCGMGDLLASIPAREKLGIDVSPRMLSRAKEKYPSIEFLEDDIEKLKFRGHFDYVLISELVGALHDIQNAFGQINHLVDERGRVVIIAHNYLWQPILVLLENFGLKRRPLRQSWITPNDIQNFLTLAGFEQIKSGRRVLLPFYVPLLSAFLNRIVVRLPFFWRFGLIHYVVARPISEVKRDYSVSIVIPARNEEGNIEPIVRRIPNFPVYWEIIFVEGHSRDGTWKEIQRVADVYKGKKNITIVEQDGKGKSDAVRKGFKLAKGDILMILDADMTVPPEDLVKFYDALSRGKGDFINGSRLVYPMEKEAMQFLNILGNKFFAGAFSWLLSQRIKDTLCGTKVLLKSDYERITANRSYFGDFDPFGDFDLLFGASRLNLKIIEIPIRYKERTYGRTQIQRWKHGWLLLKMCVFAARKLKFNP